MALESRLRPTCGCCCSCLGFEQASAGEEPTAVRGGAGHGGARFCGDPAGAVSDPASPPPCSLKQQIPTCVPGVHRGHSGALAATASVLRIQQATRGSRFSERPDHRDMGIPTPKTWDGARERGISAPLRGPDPVAGGLQSPTGRPAPRGQSHRGWAPPGFGCGGHTAGALREQSIWSCGPGDHVPFPPQRAALIKNEVPARGCLRACPQHPLRTTK